MCHRWKALVETVPSSTALCTRTSRNPPKHTATDCDIAVRTGEAYASIGAGKQPRPQKNGKAFWHGLTMQATVHTIVD